MNEKKLLLFQFSPQEKAAVTALCDELRSRLLIRPVEIKKEKYAQPLGFLAGIEGIASTKARYMGMPFPGEMLVFSGFTGQELDLLLDIWKQKGLKRIPLKAVLTPHNILWTPERLYRELLSEHTSIGT